MTAANKSAPPRAGKLGAGRRGEPARTVRETGAARAARALGIARALKRLYPHARISLDFETPWQCLAATVLSAQCTDERVNRVTPELFRRLPDAAAMAAAPPAVVERLIAATGFFRSKTKSLQGAARALLERFGGELPHTMEELVTLPGVGRKTANVILGHVFGVPGMVVDTHVRRLSKRLGLTRNSDPGKIETDLASLIPAAHWTSFSMRLILHGRAVCHARRPECGQCALLGDCPQIGVADGIKSAKA